MVQLSRANNIDGPSTMIINMYPPIPPETTNSKYVTLSSSGLKLRYTDTCVFTLLQHTSSSSSPSQNITTLLFIHGFAGCLESWIPVIQKLTTKTTCSSGEGSFNFRLVALDLPGSGFSDKPLLFDYTFRNQGKMVSQFIKELDLKNVIVVGHSSGGVVAAAVVSQSDADDIERIKGAVLLAPGIFSVPVKYPPEMISTFATKMCTHSERKETLQKYVKNKKGFLPEVLQAHLCQLSTPNYKDAMTKLMQTIEPPYPEIMYDAKAPLHFIWSKEDPINPPADEKLLELINKGKIKVPVTISLIEDSFHYIQFDQPAKVVNEIIQFVKTIS